MLLFRKLDLYISKSAIIKGTLFTALLFAIGFSLALHPPTYTTTDVVNETTVEGSFTHYSESTQTTNLVTEGTVYENRNNYFLNSHTTLVTDYSISNTSEDPKYMSQILVSTQRTNTEIGSITLPREDVENPILTYTEEGLIEINIEELQTVFSQLQEETPRGSQIELEIQSQTTVEEYNQTITDTLSIRIPNNQMYTVSTTTNPYQHQETEQNIRIQESQTTTLFGQEYWNIGLLGILLSFISAGVTSYLIFGFYNTRKSPEVVLFKYQFEKYQDWITTGRPAQDPSLQNRSNLILIDDLEGLVDVAIQNDSRVVYTKSLNQFFVYDGNATYVYEHPKLDDNIVWNTLTSQNYSDIQNISDTTSKTDKPSFTEAFGPEPSTEQQKSEEDDKINMKSNDPFSSADITEDLDYEEDENSNDTDTK